MKTTKIKQPSTPITTATVRVLRSHDYCHFEVALTTDITEGNTFSPVSVEDIDELRKTAARLADKAVEQYKEAKSQRSKADDIERAFDRFEAQKIEAIPETDRTPEQQATLKAWKDRVYEANRAYDYQDDWDNE